MKHTSTYHSSRRQCEVADATRNVSEVMRAAIMADATMITLERSPRLLTSAGETWPLDTILDDRVGTVTLRDTWANVKGV